MTFTAYIWALGQGWQKPGFYEYCPAQWAILGKSGFYWVLLGNTGQYELLVFFTCFVKLKLQIKKCFISLPKALIRYCINLSEYRSRKSKLYTICTWTCWMKSCVITKFCLIVKVFSHLHTYMYMTNYVYLTIISPFIYTIVPFIFPKGVSVYIFSNNTM